MANVTEAKYSMQGMHNKLFNPINKEKSSNPFLTDYESDYNAKKKAEKEQIHEEIRRIYEVN